MCNLIRAEWERLLHSLIYRIALLVSVGLPVVIMIGRWWDIQKHREAYESMGEEWTSPDALLFASILCIALIVAACISIFLGTEYADGTIRNKLMVGHKRSSIYLSKIIVCLVATTLLWVWNVACAWLMGRWLLGKYLMETEAMGKTFLVGLVAMWAATALILMISMLIQNIGIGTMVNLLVYIAAIVFSVTVYQKLRAPEYYPEFEIDPQSGQVEAIEKKNELYLGGTARKIYEVLNTLPYGQMGAIADGGMIEDVPLALLYDGVMIVVSSAIGIVVFKKSNLK